MKLVNRVSVFFLAALAVILSVYSGMFYAFVRGQIVQQFEQQLQSALNSLVAAVEIEPEEVKWQPLEHLIALGAVQGPDELQWAVIGDGSRVVEKSRNVTPDLITQAKQIASRPASRSDNGQVLTAGDWHVLHQRLIAPAPQYDEREPDEFDEITVVVARTAAPLLANLQRFLWFSCVLPVGTWLVAAVAGHWFCRRALWPVREMSDEARAMTRSNSHSWLPVSETGDELAELAMAFNTLLDHRHRAFEQQRRFTGDAAHELRTPLTVLLGQIDVALRRPRSPKEYADTLRQLRDETTQLQKIVESLLFLARTGEEAVLPDSETISLAVWLPDYMNRWSEHPRRDDISLRANNTGLCQITATISLLSRLLDNLIENALKYSEPGAKVEVELSNDDTQVQVAIQDQGRGIAVEDQAQIFNPFFRTRAARNAGIAGTGLGLAIAARIATAFDGRLDCSSVIDQGSCFTLRLPLDGSSQPTKV